jgi:NADH-quinone oxidoreductase subunit F
MLDVPYDFDSLQQAGSMSGSGAIIVMDDTTDIVAALANIADFYAHESCGQCTPCREGSLWLAKALHRMDPRARAQAGRRLRPEHRAEHPGPDDLRLWRSCAWPVLSFVNKFRDEFEARGAADEAKNAAAGPSHGMKIAASP